jgi:hypothetical protein
MAERVSRNAWDHRLTAAADSKRPFRFLWSCFGGCLGKGGEGDAAYLPVAIPRKGNCDADTEMRIKKWILESSLCYGKVPDSSCQSESLSSTVSVTSDGLECRGLVASAYPDNSQPADKVSSSTINKKEQNRNRWKGRRPAIAAEAHPSPLPTHEIPASPAAPIQLQVGPATSRLVPLHRSPSRDLNAGRVVWMRRSAVLQRTRPSRIAAQPARARAWLVPASCASTLK